MWFCHTSRVRSVDILDSGKIEAHDARAQAAVKSAEGGERRKRRGVYGARPHNWECVGQWLPIPSRGRCRGGRSCRGQAGVAHYLTLPRFTSEQGRKGGGSEGSAHLQMPVFAVSVRLGGSFECGRCSMRVLPWLVSCLARENAKGKRCSQCGDQSVQLSNMGSVEGQAVETGWPQTLESVALGSQQRRASYFSTAEMDLAGDGRI